MTAEQYDSFEKLFKILEHNKFFTYETDNIADEILSIIDEDELEELNDDDLNLEHLDTKYAYDKMVITTYRHKFSGRCLSISIYDDSYDSYFSDIYESFPVQVINYEYLRKEEKDRMFNG